MIKTIRHKGLRLYYEKGNSSKLPKSQLSKISRVLTALNAIVSKDDIMGPAYRRELLHHIPLSKASYL